MRWTFWILFSCMLIVAGCGRSRRGRPVGDDTGPGWDGGLPGTCEPSCVPLDGPATPFAPFPVLTGGYASTGDTYQISLTDGTGTVACALPEDAANSLGVAGSQVLVNVGDGSGYPCPVGTYSVPSTCPDD